LNLKSIIGIFYESVLDFSNQPVDWLGDMPDGWKALASRAASACAPERAAGALYLGAPDSRSSSWPEARGTVMI
jgi:hypothetical protein